MQEVAEQLPHGVCLQSNKVRTMPYQGVSSLLPAAAPCCAWAHLPAPQLPQPAFHRRWVIEGKGSSRIQTLNVPIQVWLCRQAKK